MANTRYNSTPPVLADKDQKNTLDVDSSNRLLVNVGATVPGTGATSLGKAEDAAHASGDTGVAVWGVANEAQVTFAADGDYTPVAVDTKGTAFVKGNVTAADGSALTLTQKSFSILGGYNGTTADLIRSGDVNNVAAATGYVDALGIGRYNSTLPTITTAQYNALQIGLRGSLHVELYAADGATALNRTPADGATLQNALVVGAHNLVYNGATSDLSRSAINATNSIGTGIAAAALVAQLDDTSPTTITENQFGNVRMSTDHALLVSNNPYPSSQTPLTATSGIVANASTVATMPAVASRTNYIAGFTATPGTATGAAQVKVVVSGLISGSMTFYVMATNATTFVPAPCPLVVAFNPPIPASAVNTAIVVTMDAVGAGGATAAANSWGFLI